MITPTPIPESVHAALVEQYNYERFSNAVYLSLAASLENMNWSKFADWMTKSSDEELAHAKKVFRYLGDRDAEIRVEALPLPSSTPTTIVDAFGMALEHEKLVTERWKSIYKLAYDAVDPMTCEFALAMLKEQVEEESKVFDVYFKLTVAGADPAAVLEIEAHV